MAKRFMTKNQKSLYIKSSWFEEQIELEADLKVFQQTELIGQLKKTRWWWW